ncbi:MAG: Asp-tRNA(Asn)/Glu-tRNA(Gln) amidotransferase subunit GatA [Actinomycetota bacterium]|nr:Asp-tRNA(Asn)/Glu-tRNA(Gln) amidotransferase subunit GatA [Actinomycetota bacterium]
MLLYEMTLSKLHDELTSGRISAMELLDGVLKRIASTDSKLKAYLRLTEEEALKAAKAADARLLAKEGINPLLGIPFAIKDNMCTEGISTTCASKILDGYVPAYSASVAQRLFNFGAVMVGKANMDEFAMGSSTENSAYQITANPWDLSRVPGGSSGGSAAAVAAGQAIFALGSDTGGSIRQPAALCGVVGMKPTYGLVSRYGLIAFASSLDQIGPIAKSVTDAALILNAICGHDPMDSTSLKVGTSDFTQGLEAGVKGLKVGVPKELMGEGIDDGVKAKVEEAIKIFEGLGASVKEASLPHSEYALSAYYLIAPAEASSNLARFDGVRYGHRTKEDVEDMVDMYSKTRAEGFGAEVKRRIMLGTYALSAGYYDAYYGQAQKVRTLIMDDFKKAFSEHDVLISPTTPTSAFKGGEKTKDPLSMYMSDICTIPTNLAGIPAISVPCGLSEGLPVGLQIMGKALDEPTILRAAYAFEKEFNFSERPKL